MKIWKPNFDNSITTIKTDVFADIQILFYEGGRRSGYLAASKIRAAQLSQLRQKDKVYPLLSQRGYYSEVLTNEFKLGEQEDDVSTRCIHLLVYIEEIMAVQLEA